MSLQVHDAYCRVCRKRDVAPTDQSEFISLCQLLETRGLLMLRKAKEARMMKVCRLFMKKFLPFLMLRMNSGIQMYTNWLL